MTRSELLNMKKGMKVSFLLKGKTIKRLVQGIGINQFTPKIGRPSSGYVVVDHYGKTSLVGHNDATIVN